MFRRLSCLIAILASSGCKGPMSAECKAVLQLPPPPLMSLESSVKVASDGAREWTISKFNPGQLPLILDVSADTSGLATAPLVFIEPGGREPIFVGKTNANESSLDVAIPRFAFTSTLPAVGKVRSPIDLLFPIDHEVATISQSPLDGTASMRGRSHTAGRGGQFEAIDIDAPLGTTIVAPADGFIAHTYDDSPDVRCDHFELSGYGNYVMLVTEDDVTLMLAHLKQDSIRVENGTRVRRGEPIAQVGHSGSGGVDHLHLVALALGPSGVDSIPIRFAACGSAADGWTPRNGPVCR